MAQLVDSKGLLVDHFGAAIRTEGSRRRGRCLPLASRHELARPGSPSLNLAMNGVVVEVPDLGVIGSEVRQRISIYVLYSKNIMLM